MREVADDVEVTSLLCKAKDGGAGRESPAVRTSGGEEEDRDVEDLARREGFAVYLCV